MKTSIKVAFVLVLMMVALSCIAQCIAQFASGNISAGMAYITTTIWMWIAYLHYDRAERYCRLWLELLAKQHGLVLKEDDRAHRKAWFCRKKEDDEHGN